MASEIDGDNRKGSAPSPHGEEYLDAAPWAIVESWDPARKDGARATGMEEFHPDDISPGKELIADQEGNYRPTAYPDGRSSIGLAWPTRRTISRLEIQFAGKDNPPDIENTQVEYWEGISAWQGKWTPLKGRLAETPTHAWQFLVDSPGQVTQKIRWIFYNMDSSLRVKPLVALTPSPMISVEIVVISEPSARGTTAALQITNGAFTGGKRSLSLNNLDLGSPLRLTVRSTKPTKDTYSKADRTVLLFKLPKDSFAVAIDDVLNRGPVYIPRTGIYISRTESAKSLDEHKASIASQKTVLEKVRALPEQTREQAMAKTHYDPRLNDGPVMLSLACDNNKFIVEKNGGLSYHENFVTIIHKQGEWPRELPPLYRIAPRYGDSRVVISSQGWGKLGINAPATNGTGAISALRIRDKTYTKGLGHHSKGDIIIELDGEYERFECETGVQWLAGGSAGSVVFQVLVDDKIQYDSGVMRMDDPAKPVSISVSGARRLILHAGDAGDGIGSDMANWAEARLIKTRKSAPLYISDLIQKEPSFERHLQGGWLPAPINVTEVDGVRYSQRTYVVPFEKNSTPFGIGGKPLAVVEITIENGNAHPAKASVQMEFSPGSSQNSPISISGATTGSIVSGGGRLLAAIETGEAQVGKTESLDSTWKWTAELPGNSKSKLIVYLPAWSLTPAQEGDLPLLGSDLFSRFTEYWNGIMGSAAQVETPDKWLTDLIRASQVHIYMAARNEEHGTRIVPWIASRSYPHAIDSEGNSVVRAMAQFGHFEFARRSFDFYFSRYKPEGYMTTGYTLIGSGWHLRTLAEYVRHSADYEWFRQRANHPMGMCRWIMAQRQKTMNEQAEDEKKVGYGLMPPGTVADWGVFAHYFYGEGQYCSGLNAMGELLAKMGYAEGRKYVADAEEHRDAIKQSYEIAQASAPAVPLQDGTWAPFHPLAANVPGRVDDLYCSMRDAFVNNWLYDVELGAQQLAVFGIINLDDPRIDDMLNDMEDNQFLRDGARAYPASMNRTDWFNMGGFGKAQPYYAQIPEIYALRDDIKPFLRSYFNTLAAQINPEVLSIYEGFTPACINKTHETGYFLSQSRNMLVMERGEELWLASLTPREWLKDGKKIEVKNIPTEFGPVSYRIHSSIASGSIEVEIDPPTRSLPSGIVLRLRHPEGKTIRGIEAESENSAEISYDKETIRIKPTGGIFSLKASFQ